MTEQQVNPERARPTLMEVCDEIREGWVSRAKCEADLVTQTVEKMTAARSIADTTAIYSEWASRRMELLAEDNRRLWDDTRKVMDAGALLVASKVPGVPGITS
jgi:hypothetical protein